MEDNQYFYEGYNAYDDATLRDLCLGIKACPYLSNDPRAEEWKRGYRKAESEDLSIFDNEDFY